VLRDLWTLPESSFSLFVIISLGAYLVIFVLSGRWRERVFDLLDKSWGFVIFTALWMLMMACVSVHHAYSDVRARTEKEIAQINQQVSGELQHLTSLPAVQSPIAFLYLDSSRTEALYSQVEPELVEKQRTVATTANGRAKVDLQAGAASTELSTEKGKASTSSFARQDFSPERKCIEVMQFAVSNNRARYYTTADAWITTEKVRESILKAQGDRVAALESRIPPVVTILPTGQQQATWTVTLTGLDTPEHALQTELQDSKGLVFLDEVFNPLNGTVLIGEFSREPRRIFFRVTVPGAAKLDVLPKARLRVFGDVIRGLTSEGYVDVRAIALY
jgi:hypothetical protein